ncbi:FAD-binding oxidoreductase [Pararobbsia silviterrae]|uniref:FAD-binding oxidoreductase n=1 Tax=Pararobbsia silviterrae TaxID=1792498 RepID=A0A494YAG3_9BURK|nr:FAD-binding oxidoreductase [Pararobbsia silviterrae]RKP57625.1 FAD-binding oxidoreductase [Pararobbsia silviterrae]
MTTHHADTLGALRAELPDLDWTVEPIHLKRLSRDFHWFSPVLKRELDGKLADAVVCPRSEDELRAIVAGCARAGIPITVRGGGTGNYGQAVPLNGGLVIDMTALTGLVFARDGVARAQAGIKLAALDTLLRPQGWALRCVPSTYRIATLGGLFCGGFGGVGSINYGPLGAPGTILGIKLMTVEAEPRIVELRAPEAMRLAHTYGTNGIVLEIELALAPAQDWDEYLIAFDDERSAFAFAHTLACEPAIAKNEVALFSHEAAAYFSKLTPHRQAHEAIVIAAVARQSGETLAKLVANHGARIAWTQDAETARNSQHTLIEYCWNHTTLHALRGDKTITYLQTAYEYGREREQLDAIASAAGAEVLTHLEFIRDMQGRMTCVGLPLIRYTNDARLTELTRLHRSLGIKVNDPHVFTLEDGKHAGALDPAILDAKREYDPNQLLNPGKIRTVY